MKDTTMAVKESIIPFYAKATMQLIGLCVFIGILYVLQPLIVPLIFAMLIAIVLNPVVSFFLRLKMNRIVSITLAITVAFLVITIICFLLFSQVSRFSESWPGLVDKLGEMLNQTITWISKHFKIDQQNIQKWISNTKGDILKNSSAVIGITLMSVGSFIMIIVLVPVYIFLLLYYKPLLLQFIYSLFGSKHQFEVVEVTAQTEILIQRYLIGLLIEALIIATLNSIGLLILGIDFAIMLAIIGALVNVIPYIGGIVAVTLPILMALATKSPVYALYVMAIYFFIQLIDNHYIVPIIVASKVKINALFSILIVLAGNALWGIPGMFLSIPLLAIVKLIFDHIENLKPLGLLLGDSLPVDKQN